MHLQKAKNDPRPICPPQIMAVKQEESGLCLFYTSLQSGYDPKGIPGCGVELSKLLQRGVARLDVDL